MRRAVGYAALPFIPPELGCVGTLAWKQSRLDRENVKHEGQLDSRGNAPVGVEPHSMDAVIDLYKRDVDRTLLMENLRCTVEQRFLRLMELQKFAAELQKAGRAHRGS